MTLRVALADDEILSQALMISILGDLADEFPDLQIVSQTGDGQQTVEAVKQHQPDILFLDINMPAGDGFSVLAELDKETDLSKPAIIFTTAHSRFAAQAFEVEAVDYLLKPLSEEKVLRSMHRVLKAKSGLVDDKLKVIAVPVASGTEYVAVDNIMYVEASSEYVFLVLPNKKLMLRKSLKALAHELPEEFFQTHRSYIVNATHVESMLKAQDGGSHLEMESGEKIPVSRRLRTNLQKRLAGHQAE